MALRSGRRSYRAVPAPEAIQLLARLLELLFRHLRLQALLGDVPQFLVLFLQQHDGARGLRVEGAGDVQDCFAHDFDDAVVADGRAVTQGVNAAPRLDGREEFGGGNHFGGGGGESPLAVVGGGM